MSRFRWNSWCISDTHFGHSTIVKYCNRPTNHDYIIADAWRRMVGPKDLLLHLGDLTVWYGIKQATWEAVAAALPGKKYLIAGNHDERSVDYYAEMGFRVIEPFVAKMGDIRVLFTHEPEYEKRDDWDVNIHGHTHNTDHREKGVPTPSHCLNASIEHWNYRPVHIGDILADRFNTAT